MLRITLSCFPFRAFSKNFFTAETTHKIKSATQFFHMTGTSRGVRRLAQVLSQNNNLQQNEKIVLIAML